MDWRKAGFICLLSFLIFQKKKELIAQELFISPKINESKAQVCARFNKSLVAYVDLVFYVKNCRLRPVESSDLINTFVQEKDMSIVTLSDKSYSLLPLGKSYDFAEYYTDYIGKLGSGSFCNTYNNKIVTSDSYNYYYIDNCKRRLFRNYHSASLFNKSMSLVQAISPFYLLSFPLGNDMPALKQDNSFAQKTETEILESLPSVHTLCKGLTQKVVSFYDSFFYLEHCTLRKISDFSLNIQVAIDNKGGVQELTLKQALGLPRGKAISAKAVLQKL